MRHPHRHARVHDARHRPDAAGVVVGHQRDLAVLDELQRLRGRSGDALEPQRRCRARRASERTCAAGSIGGPAWVTPPAAWCGGDLGGRDDVDHHRPRRGQARDRIRLCMQRCVHGPAKLNRTSRACNRTGGHNRARQRGPLVRGRRRRAIRTLGRWASTTLPTSTTAVAWPAWRGSTAARRTRRSRARSRRSTTSSTAAPRARTPRPATAPAS